MPPMSQCDILLPGGQTISIDNTDDGDLLIAIDSGEEKDPMMIRLKPIVAAYMCGQIAARTGMRFG